MTTTLCLHGDAGRCPCRVPAGMTADTWETANGHHYRVLAPQGDYAWLFVVRHANGRIDDGTVERPSVQTSLGDEGLRAAEARRFGRALIEAADQLDALIAWGT